MMESLKPVLEEGYMGALCEVVTQENSLVDYVRIQAIDYDALDFRPSRAGQDLPELYYGMQVKLTVYNYRLGLKVLSGMVVRTGKKHLRIGGLDVLAQKDRREYLRIKSNATASVTLLDKDDSGASDAEMVRVRLKDISLDGLMFTSPVFFPLESTVQVRLNIYESPLDLRCVIRRISKNDDDMSHRYGCQFVSLSSAQEDILHRLILRLQRSRLAQHNRRDEEDNWPFQED